MYKKVAAVLMLALIAYGLPAFACSTCGCKAGDKEGKTTGSKKACPKDCQKACCQEKACPKDCQEACCQKKACPKDCQEACCQKQAQTKETCCPASAKTKKHACTQEKCSGTAPDFTLADQKGKEVKLSDYLGKKIVVLEWANWDCPFVVPHYTNKTFAKMIRKYTGKDKETGKEREVVWLTVNSTHDAKAENNKAWAKQHKLKHQILSDPTGKVGRLYKATNTPHMFVIDKTGHIAYQGAIDNAPRGNVPEDKKYVNYVDQALKELTAGKKITTAKTKPYGCSVKYPSKEKTEG